MTATVKLYELAEARNILDEFLGETEGEVTPELQQLLDELAGKAEEKIERVALYVREQLATAAAIDEAAGLAWAREKQMCLVPESLDVKAVKKLATVQPLPFVTITETPSVRIATDLSAVLGAEESAQ